MRRVTEQFRHSLFNQWVHSNLLSTLHMSC
jgi:hypothetical protein